MAHPPAAADMTSTSDAIGIFTWANSWGGTETHTINTARTLAARGHRVTIVQLDHGVYSSAALEDLRGIELVRPVLPRPMRQLPVRYWSGLLQRYGIRTGVLAKGSFNVRWPALGAAMLVSGRRFVSVEHSCATEGIDLLHGNGRRRRELWRYRFLAELWLHRRALHEVIAVSAAVKARLVEYFGFPARQIQVIHNGVDANRFRPDAAARAAARARWDIPAEGFVFGSVTRFAPEKHLHRLLEAFERLGPTTGHNAWLVLIGAGPDAEALRARAQQFGIGGRCIWPGESAAPWREYPGFDAFAMTSALEGMPYALLEAMACERSVVAMAAGGIAEALQDGITGRLISHDVGAFAGAMRDIMAEPAAQRAAMGARARGHVLEHHDQRRQLERVSDRITAGR